MPSLHGCPFGPVITIIVDTSLNLRGNESLNALIYLAQPRRASSTLSFHSMRRGHRKSDAYSNEILARLQTSVAYPDTLKGFSDPRSHLSHISHEEYAAHVLCSAQTCKMLCSRRIYHAPKTIFGILGSPSTYAGGLFTTPNSTSASW